VKVGIDTFSLHPLKLGPFECLEHIAELGFAGVQLGSVSEVSRELDEGVLREYRARADELGLYSLGGVGAPNPHVGGKAPDELVAAIIRQIEAAAKCGWHELRTVLGGPKERYELDVDWPQQLADSADVLRQVLPVLRHHGSRIDLENHGETTSFEVVRLAEELGPDAIGVCLDTANLLIFAEDPVAAARRVAPYTHLTHADGPDLALQLRRHRVGHIQHDRTQRGSRIGPVGEQRRPKLQVLPRAWGGDLRPWRIVWNTPGAPVGSGFETAADLALFGGRQTIIP